MGKTNMRKYTMWMLLNIVIVIGLSAMAPQQLLYAAEFDASDNTISTENETSVILPMNDMPAGQLGINTTYKANPLNDYKELKTPRSDYTARRLLFYRRYLS